MASATIIPFTERAQRIKRQEQARREQAFIEACEIELEHNPVDLNELIARATLRAARMERQR